MGSKTATFTAVLEPREKGLAHAIELPFSPKEGFGKARAPIKVTLGRHTYRTTVAVYGGKSYVGIRESNREAAGLEVGDRFEVRIELDEEPRTVAVPKDLASALKRDREARAFFDALSFTCRKEYADWIEGAKKAETRASRVAKTVDMLREKKKTPR